MEEFTKDELLARLDYIINDERAQMADLALLVFDPRFPAEFYNEARADLEHALAVQRARASQQRNQLDL